jgi:hypothetical protein
MTAWESWALRDPEGAGIELAEDAIADGGYTALELYNQGPSDWYLPPCLDPVRDQILEAAFSYLYDRAH